MYILVIGTPLMGYKFVGPFDDEDAAIEYGDKVYANTEFWVAPVDTRLATIEHNEAADKEFLDMLDEDIKETMYCSSCNHLWSNHNQNVHGIYVCRECPCRGMIPPNPAPSVA